MTVRMVRAVWAWGNGFQLTPTEYEGPNKPSSGVDGRSLRSNTTTWARRRRVWKPIFSHMSAAIDEKATYAGLGPTFHKAEKPANTIAIRIKVKPFKTMPGQWNVRCLRRRRRKKNVKNDIKSGGKEDGLKFSSAEMRAELLGRSSRYARFGLRLWPASKSFKVNGFHKINYSSTRDGLPICQHCRVWSLREK